MFKASKEIIQELRAKTGVSVMAVKRALERSAGDIENALKFLKEEGALVASQKRERATKSGIIQSYVHSGKIGVLVELRCETDFVAQNPEFQSFGREICLQVAALNPEDVEALLKTPYIRDTQRTISDLLKEAKLKFGENIEISRFSRLEL